MKAYVINKFGSPENFELINLPIPEISDNEVLINVRATSVNPVDYKLRRGDMPSFTHSFPAILHMDVSGVIEKIGRNVKHLKVGDEVYGIAGGIKSRQGALAEYVTAPAALIHPKPKNLSFLESAGVPLVSLTAWEALIFSVDIKPEDKVLVHAGAGSVGHLGVQIAKLKGAKVYTTVSNYKKSKIAKELGADVVINYKDQPVEKYVNDYTDGNGFDIIFDTVGGENYDSCLKAARLRGHVVSIVARGSHDLLLAASKGLHLHMANVTHPISYGKWVDQQSDALKAITQLFQENQLKILIDDKKFKMNEIAEAHSFAETGKNIGKVCVEW